MKALSLLLCAVFALAITCQAQTTDQNQLPNTGDNMTAASSTWRVAGAPVPSDAKLYALSEAYPIAKSLLGQKILLQGQVGKLVNTPPHWINMVDKLARVEIQTFITQLPGVRDTQTIQCYGAFEMQKVPLGLKLVFTAISIRTK